MKENKGVNRPGKARPHKSDRYTHEMRLNNEIDDIDNTHNQRLSKRCRMRMKKPLKVKLEDIPRNFKIQGSTEQYFGRPPIFGDIDERRYSSIFIDDKYELDFEATSRLAKFSDWIDQKAYDYHIFTNIIEAVAIFSWQLSRSKDGKDRTVAIMNLAKHLDGNNSLVFGTFTQLLSRAFATNFNFELQSDDDEKSFIESIKDVLNHYEEFKRSKFCEKFHRFIMYALSFRLFNSLGLNMDKLQFSKMSQEVIRKKYHMGPDFIHCLMDTMVFMVERGQQFLRTGQLDSIFHDSDTYGEWFEKSLELKQKSNFVSNPEPHGFTQYDYEADLRDNIEKGDAIMKHAKIMEPFLYKKTVGIQADLKLLLANHISKRDASKDRPSPFAICLSGGSGVGKSTFKGILVHHFGKVWNLPLGDEYTYTRNFVDPYFVNYNSSQWAVVMDDVAFYHPNKAPNGDPSLMELIQIINKIAFTPAQAALEDKGKTPMRCKLVVATTNTPDLNAKHYFSCPLAVQRRLPYVIEVKPKKKYTKFKYMLDGKKVPKVRDGEYPDYWDIEVYSVQPNPKAKDVRKQQAIHKLIFSTSDINLFLDWYTKQILQFRAIQSREDDCDSKIKHINICKSCYRTAARCDCDPEPEEVISHLEVQAGEPQNTSTFLANFFVRRAEEQQRRRDEEEQRRAPTYWGMLVSRVMRYCFVNLFVFKWIVENVSWFSNFKETVHNELDYEDYCALFRHLGKRVKRKIGYNDKYTPAIKFLAKAGALTLLGSMIYSYISAFDDTIDEPPIRVPEETKEEASECVNPSVISKKDVASVQVLHDGIEEEVVKLKLESGRAPVPDEVERENVWYKETYQITPFDIPQTSASYKTMSERELLAKLGRNCVNVTVIQKSGSQTRSISTGGLCIGGHIYMFNNHGIPTLDEDSRMKVTVAPDDEGVNGNISFKIVESQIIRYPDRDLCFVKINNIPPKKGMWKIFMNETLRGIHKGFLLGRNTTGHLDQRSILNIRCKTFDLEELNICEEMWLGITRSPTSKGDCGSILVSTGTNGPIILGIHVGGDGKHVGALPISNQFLKEVTDRFGGPIIQPNCPLLNALDTDRELTSIHAKATARFLQSGTAVCHGSFKGFRPRHKSHVKENILCESMKTRGYKLNHGKPIMRSWEPWNNALQDMVKPNSNFDQSVLDSCVKSFTSDILGQLSPEDLGKIHVYDVFTAINGCPGVAYVDGINANTSMGYPWKKSKKFYSRRGESTDGVPNPLIFDREILDRVDQCEEVYQCGLRYMPIFSGHLKDEPTSFKKIGDKKTRVFTGAPVDYSIVTRMYFLSMIRTMQNNRFVFECGPGTIAQSLEWEEIYEYLTQHGKDRMVAGDYTSYDKSMSSQIMLAAFQVMYNIFEAAGYSEQELLVVQGIAEDTCFPLVDFNGDLMSFYGSNPSGHPLTVILNSLVNSLYIRYAYSMRSPSGNCDDFRKNVALMTYGDDNVMGIKCDFLDHTILQAEMSKLGITYTMADKEAKSVPFIHIDDVSFLKRAWRWDEDIGAIVAPLEEKSIHKMLMINVASKTIPPEAHGIATIASAIREYFWYGKEVFEKKTQLFKDLIEENNLQDYQEDSTLPSWESLKSDFWHSSRHVKLKRLGLVKPRSCGGG